MRETTSAWWTSRSIMAAATTSSPKTSPQRPNGLLLVTIKLGPLVAAGDELEEQVRCLGFEGDVADLVDLSRYRHRSTYADPATMPSLWRRELETSVLVAISVSAADGSAY